MTTQHTVTLNFENTEQLLDFFAKLNNQEIHTAAGHLEGITILGDDRSDGVPNAGTTAEAEAATESAGRPRKTRTKKGEETVPPVDLAPDSDKALPKRAEKTPAEEVPTDAELDYNRDVRPTALTLIKSSKGTERLQKIFDEFGVNNAKELKQDQLKPFLDAVNLELKKTEE